MALPFLSGSKRQDDDIAEKDDDFRLWVCRERAVIYPFSIVRNMLTVFRPSNVQASVRVERLVRPKQNFGAMLDCLAGYKPEYKIKNKSERYCSLPMADLVAVEKVSTLASTLCAAMGQPLEKASNPETGD